jgi:hypothetical protein
MKNTKIRNIDDVKSFFTHLLDVESLNFHPDDDFENYICLEGPHARTPSYTPEEAALRNAMMVECFEVCKRAGVDIYDIGYNLVYGRLKKQLNFTEE